MKCYIDRDNKVFKETGEFRAPEIGEYFLYLLSRKVAKCVIEYLPDEKRIILKENKT